MIQITADTRRAVVTNKELLTVGSAGIQVEFTLSEDWNALSKLAVFRVGDDGTKVDVVLGESLTCVVPPEVLKDEDEVLFIGVYGTNGQGTVIIPTVWASAGVVKPGTEPETPASATPTPEIWAQILSVANDAEQTATEAMSIVGAGLQDLSTLEGNVEAAEAQRVVNEQDRVAAEQQRVLAENNREAAENTRASTETVRVNAETSRVTAEAGRVSAENARVSAEAARVTAEEGRVAAEENREAHYAEYVTTVQGYANAASASATSAAGSATDAASSASSASISAWQAASSASSASTSASQASNSASSASTSATTASSAATTATTKAGEAAASATAAGNAQTAAETAQTAAETAQSAAESAQAAAEEAAQDVIYKAPVIINTASGDIATFADGADGMQIRKLVGTIVPVQDLHGYDHPWPAGGGINIFDYDNPVLVTVEYGGSAKDRYGHSYTNAGSYAINAYNPSYMYFGAIVKYADNTWSTINYVVSNGASSTPKLINISSGDTLYVIDIQPESQEESIEKLNRNKVQVAFSNTQPTEWYPYENICPISGWTGANIQQSKSTNLFYLPDGELGGGTRRTASITDGVISIVVGAGGIATSQVVTFGTVPHYQRLIPQGTYVFRIFNLNSASLNAANMQLDYSENGVIKSVVNGGAFTVTEEAGAAYVAIYNTSQTVYASGTHTFSASITPVALDTNTYVKAVRTTLPINWQTEAGTVYAGTLDVLSGKVVSTYGILTCTDTSTESWTVTQTSGGLYRFAHRQAGIKGAGNTSRATIISNIAKTTAEDEAGGVKQYAYDIWYYPSDASITTEAQLREWLGKNNLVLQLLYPLANPLEYTLSPNDLLTYYGHNNVWIDTGSISECDYPADTKLYIDGLTEPDEDMIADDLIASGKYFTVNNQLYLSTAQIAAGAQIIPGSNCTATSITEALNALNS